MHLRILLFYAIREGVDHVYRRNDISSITFIYTANLSNNVGTMELEEDKIKKIRRHIDRVDTVIITALAERMSLVEDIGRYKKKHEIPVFDEEREIQIMNALKKIAKAQGLDEEFVEEVFLSTFNEAKRIQNEIINGPNSAE